MWFRQLTFSFGIVLKRNNVKLLWRLCNLFLQKISEEFSLDEIVSRLLVIRNIDQDNINSFLNPTIKSSMPNPYQIIDMGVAINRIYESLEKSDTIGIFGDYDVDGASSTALLTRYFLSIKQKVKT